jgi:hypothetical protein
MRLVEHVLEVAQPSVRVRSLFAAHKTTKASGGWSAQRLGNYGEVRPNRNKKMATPPSTFPRKRKTWPPFFCDDATEGVQQNLLRCTARASICVVYVFVAA